jgi:hypothetical protein
MPKCMIIYVQDTEVDGYDRQLAVASTDCAVMSNVDVRRLKASLYHLPCPYDMHPHLVILPEEGQEKHIETCIATIMKKVDALEAVSRKKAEVREAAKIKKQLLKNTATEEEEKKLLGELQKKYGGK